MTKPKNKLLIVPTTHALAGPTTLPSVHQVISDARVVLADEMESLAAMRDADPEMAGALAKNALTRADALLKLLKSAELALSLEKQSAASQVAGKNLSELSDAEIAALVREKVLGEGPAPSEG